MPQCHVAAAVLVSTRAAHRYAEPGEVRVAPLDDEGGEGERFAPDPGQPRLLDHVEHVVQRHHAEHRRCAAEEPAHTVSGHESVSHREHVCRAHPTLDGLVQFGLQPARDVGESGSARPAVEILVAAADGDIDVPGIEFRRHDARRVAEIPEHQCTGLVGDRGDLLHFGDESRAVCDLAQNHESRVRADRVGHEFRCHASVGIGIDPAQGEPALGRDPLEDEAIRRKVVPVYDDLGAARPRVHGRPNQLVEQDGGGVGDNALACGSAEGHVTDAVSEGQRQLHPLFVP